MCCGCNEKIHKDYRSLVEKKGWHSPSLSEKGPDPCLDRLLLLFWAHYMRMVPIYYAQVCFSWLPFIGNKGKNVADYFKEKDIFSCKGRSG